MKISCNVEIVIRGTNSLNLKTKTKASAATLALCHKPKAKKSSNKDQPSDKDVFLIICTHRTPRGNKYNIYNNVEKLFTKFLNEGKATLRFKQPSHDIIISKADPLQLKGFLHGVGLTLVGQGAGKIRLSPTPVKVEIPKQKLSITEKKNYPLRSKFPPELTWLQVSNCRLCKVEDRILKLQHLQVLDLSYNNIRELPVALADLTVKELVLQHNRIREFPVQLSLGKLGQSLQILDLSFNEIKKISPYFCLMKNISVLSLKENRLSALPRNFQCMESLRMFSASHNDLKFLPFGIRKLQLDTLDLFHNPLDTEVVLQPRVLWQLPSLAEWAALSIVRNKVSYQPEELPTFLNDYIVERCPCPCGKLVFQRESSCILVLDLYKLASTVVYINNTSRFKVPLEVFFCSTKCWKKVRSIFFSLDWK